MRGDRNYAISNDEYSAKIRAKNSAKNPRPGAIAEEDASELRDARPAVSEETLRQGSLENYQTLRDLCNLGKSNRDTTDLRTPDRPVSGIE